MRASSLLLAWVLGAFAAAAQTDPIARGFLSPPDDAKPRVWWHWMGANITKQGIRKDLEWMRRVGIGGFQNFEGNLGVPQVVDHPIGYMTPEWKDAFRFAMQTAAALGLEGAVASSPGWSETGGPWVKPEQAMKKYVWTETWVAGGQGFNGRLPQPPAVAGAFQDKPIAQRGGLPIAPWYKDALVFAYRAPRGARDPRELAPAVTASGLGGDAPPSPAKLDAALLSDGQVSRSVLLAKTSPENPTWVRFDYSQPVTVRGLSISTSDTFPGFGEPDSGSRIRIEASGDGQSFRTVAESLCAGLQRTIALPATTARSFRVVFTAFEFTRRPAYMAAGPQPPNGIPLAELVLRTLPTVHRFEVKANFGLVNDYYAIPTPPGESSAVPRSDVVLLTGKMASDGTLNWTPPAGNWVVVRFGYSLTGHQNGPAPADATGLEVDKLSRRYVAEYMTAYLDRVAAAAGKDLMGSRGLQCLLNDSFEAGQQNWTDDMLEQFKARRGYDPSPWLPVLVGTLVESAEASDRFAWDFRRTIYELVAQAHYATITEEAHKRGLKTYGEALEDRRAYQGDDMEMRQYADIPMAAMWSFSPGASPRPTFIADDRGAASVAHIYGRKYVAAESFTGAARDRTPKSLKQVADAELIFGINRFVVHTSVHQPLDRGPGIGLGPIGQHFTRNEAWAELAGGWLSYLSRCSFLLQQGSFVADVAYFYGQEAPITGIWAWAPQTDAPAGYNFDYVNADVILNRLTAQSGQLATPTGMRYRLLYMGNRTSQITLPVLRKLRDLVTAGAVIAGNKPTGSPSNADDPREFERIATALWGDGAAAERTVGKGRVFVGRTANQVLEALQLQKDFDDAGSNARLLHHHRRLADGDVFYVVNPLDRAQRVTTSYRVQGKAVELWNPVTGEMRPASYRTENGRTAVPLELDALGSVFVVMRKPGPASREVPPPVEAELGRIDGAWSVAFQPDRGAPESVTLPALTSWTDHSDAGVKYYSGIATYSRGFDAPAGWLRTGGRTWLDLGDVRELASVTLNGRDLGIVWRPPYRVDVTGAVRAGANTLSIRVANTWVNRILGDQQPGAAKISFVPNPGAMPGTPLASGLLGPVRLLSIR